MKLGEALIQRKDLQTKLQQFSSRIAANATVVEGDKPEEDPQAIMGELATAAEELERLIVQINTANLKHTIEFGGQQISITEALAKRDVLTTLAGIYRGLTSANTLSHLRYSRTELKYESTIDGEFVRGMIEQLTSSLNALNINLQRANWTVDL